jgi:hypothetical protein
MKLLFPIRRDTLREDSVAGLVLGVQSVPDGLASGLLAGVNPLAGLYAYMVGTVTGASFTSSAFMAVHVVQAVAVGRVAAHRGRARVAVQRQVLDGELALPGVGHPAPPGLSSSPQANSASFAVAARWRNLKWRRPGGSNPPAGDQDVCGVEVRGFEPLASSV